MQYTKSIKCFKNDVNIIVDYRLELLSIIELLAGYKIILTNLDFEYKKKVNDYFSDYGDHEVVKLFNKLNKTGFTFGTPPTITLYITEDFQIRDDILIDDFYISRMGGKDNFVQFCELLYKFSKDTKFDEFFYDNISYYTKILQNTTKKVGGDNFVQELHSYYGMRKSSYNIILVSLFGPCGFGPNVKNIDGREDIYSIIGPLECKVIPSFGTDDYFKYMQRHEFSHSFINPLTLKYWDNAERYSLLLENAKKLKQYCYGDWEECLNEHIIRAIVIRLSILNKEGVGEQILQQEVQRGFIYIEAIIKGLQYYESNRCQYKSFDSYYIKLLEYLKEYSEREFKE